MYTLFINTFLVQIVVALNIYYTNISVNEVYYTHINGYGSKE